MNDFYWSVRHGYHPIVDDGEFQTNKGWICPKCSRVWSPDVNECWPCNDKLSLDDNEENPS